jgi:hypothetical protein
MSKSGIGREAAAVVMMQGAQRLRWLLEAGSGRSIQPGEMTDYECIRDTHPHPQGCSLGTPEASVGCGLPIHPLYAVCTVLPAKPDVGGS